MQRQALAFGGGRIGPELPEPGLRLFEGNAEHPSVNPPVVQGLPHGTSAEAYGCSRTECALRDVQDECSYLVVSTEGCGDDGGVYETANGAIDCLAVEVWTSGVARAMRIADLIDADTVYINASTHSPESGSKRSWNNRESGKDGKRFFRQAGSAWPSNKSHQPDPFA